MTTDEQINARIDADFRHIARVMHELQSTIHSPTLVAALLMHASHIIQLLIATGNITKEETEKLFANTLADALTPLPPDTAIQSNYRSEQGMIVPGTNTKQ